MLYKYLMAKTYFYLTYWVMVGSRYTTTITIGHIEPKTKRDSHKLLRMVAKDKFGKDEKFKFRFKDGS